MPKTHLADALSHWQKPFDGFQTSALDFFTAVENGLKEREIPDIKMSRVKFKESGVVSAERIYLRVRRKGLVFDIGAAPFGTGYFFSWWMSRPRPSAILGTLLLIVIVLGLPWLTPKLMFPIYYLLYIAHLSRALQPVFHAGPVIYRYEPFQLIEMVIVFFLIRKLAHRLSLDFDGLLGAVPLFGPVYKWAVARETYFTVDTMLMYQSLVSGVVTEAIDKLTTTKGLRALTEDEKRPIMRDFLGHAR